MSSGRGTGFFPMRGSGMNLTFGPVRGASFQEFAEADEGQDRKCRDKNCSGEQARHDERELVGKRKRQK